MTFKCKEKHDVYDCLDKIISSIRSTERVNTFKQNKNVLILIHLRCYRYYQLWYKYYRIYDNDFDQFNDL